MWKLLHKLKQTVLYDADREFYAKVFPDSVTEADLYKIRRMDQADLEEVLYIEQQNYEFPWSAGVFDDCFRTMTYTCWVCVDHNDTVIGYAIISAIVGEAHIMNISVSPAVQGRGVGRRLLNHLLDYARPRAEKVFLEVRPSNPGALHLYRSCGFEEIGIRKGYDPAKNGREDAIMLMLDFVVNAD